MAILTSGGSANLAVAAEFWKRFDAGEFTNVVRPAVPARPATPK